MALPVHMMAQESDFNKRTLLQRFIHNPDLWIPCLLLGAGILFFADFLFTSGNFYYRDILNFHYPLRRLLIEAYSRWEWPLWNPYIYLGQPMLANANYMAFYPSNLLHLLLPFNYAFKLHFILHPLLAAPGFYFFARRLRIRPLAALAGAVAYQFSGPLLSFINIYNIVPAVALIPWIGWAFVGALESMRLRRIILFGFLLALQVIALEPLTFQCTAILLCGLMISQPLESENLMETTKKVLIVASAGGALAFAFAAVQVFPTIELLQRSSRGAGIDFSFAAKWAAHPMDLISAFFPSFFGNPYKTSAAATWGEVLHAGRESYLVSYFVGTLACILAVFSILHPRRKLVYPLLILVAVSIFLALGEYNPIYKWLFDHLPLFGIGRYPSKYFLLTTLLISVLAALGFEAVFAGQRSSMGGWNKISVVFLLCLSCAAACTIWILYWRLSPQSLDSILGISRYSLDMDQKDLVGIAAHLKRSFLISAVYLSSGILFIAIALFGKKTALAGCLFVVLQAAELAPANLGLSPLISNEAVESVPEVNVFLQQYFSSRELGRVVPVDFAQRIPLTRLYAPSDSLAWASIVTKLRGLPMHGVINAIQYSICHSVDELNTRESNILFQKFVTLPSKTSVALLQKTNSPIIVTQGEMKDARVRLIRTFHTATNLKLNIYALERTMPRAYVASSIIRVGSQEEALQAFLNPDFAADQTVIVEDSGIHESVDQKAEGTAKILDYRNDYVRCDVTSATGGFLVLLDSWYPGWQAFVDGRRTDVYRANYAFRTVVVPEGNHVVEWRYRPYSFYLGLAASMTTLVSALIALSYLAWAEAKKRKGPPAEDCPFSVNPMMG
jgi:hypothetical protein